MRMIKMLREAFVDAVLADVPEIDYRAMYQRQLQEFILKRLPDIVRKVYDNPEARGYLVFSHPYASNVGGLTVFCYDAVEKSPLTAEESATLEHLRKLSEEQKDTQRALRSKLTAAIAGCSTVKSAHKLLPEFAKYLPSLEASTTPNLPAVANIVADLSKAGWPKGKA